MVIIEDANNIMKNPALFTSLEKILGISFLSFHSYST